jgi:outer membrane protein assembly factor BamB
MIREMNLVFCVLALMVIGLAHAQTGDGSLRGYARDESGAVLPGVTVTTESPALMPPSVVLTDGTGQYRVLNLSPGTYALTFEMPGFATYRQEGIVLRAGADYTIINVGGSNEALSSGRRSKPNARMFDLEKGRPD